MRRILLILTSAVILSVAGCLGDLAATRQLHLTQIILTDHLSGTFALDTSAIPAEWVEKRTDEDTRSGTVTEVRLSGGHPVKIIIVPLEPKPSGTGPGDQTTSTTKPAR